MINKIIGIIAVLALLAGGYALIRPVAPPTNTTTYVDNNGDTQVGVASGPDQTSNYTSIGGVSFYHERKAITATSSAVCAFPVPFASSTLKSLTVSVNTNGIAAAQTVDISTSTTAFGSSTPAFINAGAVGAGAIQRLVYGGSSLANSATLLGLLSTGAAVNTLQSGQFVTVRIATTTPGTFTTYWGGFCDAVFQKL